MNKDAFGRFLVGCTVTGEGENSPGILYDRGTSVPEDAATGYAKGCIFIKTDGGVGTTMYVNEGTEASADFNAK